MRYIYQQYQGIAHIFLSVVNQRELSSDEKVGRLLSCKGMEWGEYIIGVEHFSLSGGVVSECLLLCVCMQCGGGFFALT